MLSINYELANELSIDTSDEMQLLEYFSGNTVPKDAEAIAMAYAGHQFGNFVPQLGDGRAILIGEIYDKSGKLNDIQLKGSGVTAFSRQGDGRSAIGPVIREYIISEAMHAMNIPTTRALAAGGEGPSANLNSIEFVTIATDGNGTDFGDLSRTTTRDGGAVASSTRGVFAGGDQDDPSSSAEVNIIEYIQISTQGDAIDFGDLTVARNHMSGMSNAHGGL